MKTVFHSILFLIFGVTCFAQRIPVDSLYLGQIHPGSTPKIFNLLISSGYFAAERVSISIDGKEIYYSELNGYKTNSNARVKYYSYSDGKWSGPKKLFENYFSPTLSVDGNKMFLQKTTDNTSEVWYSVKSDTGWCSPARFIPSQPIDYMLWETSNGNYYFGSYTSKGGLGARDWSKLVISGNDTTVESLGTPLCSSGDDVDFGISKNDSFIIISSGTSTNRKANSNADLFISYKKSDGTWTNAKNLGIQININDSGNGRWAPCFTADNKYLFYTGGWNGPAIYWVQIDNYIKNLRFTNFNPYLKTEISNQIDTIGQLFTFKISDSTFVDDDGNNTLTYSATLSNGNALPTWLSFNAATKTFSGTPTSVGSVSLKVTATDIAMASVSSTFTLNITASKISSVKQTYEQNIQIYPNPTTTHNTVYTP